MLKKNRSRAEYERRRIALFAGAFRPPHINHFNTVFDLSKRSDIDEVVVIITNRCRGIPGTTKTLPPNVAQKIWDIYLGDLPKARVELAKKSAVKHALGFFDRVNANDTLLFCIGDSDGRFNKVETLSKKTGIAASVIRGTNNIVPIRATDLRKLLAQGVAGKKAFMASLPEFLNEVQRTEVWSECRNGMKETREIAMENVRKLIEKENFEKIQSIVVAKRNKVDEVFRVHLKSGENLFVKYANDTVKAARFSKPQGSKPRKRLKAEIVAIKSIRTSNIRDIDIPRVKFFDKGTRTLILTEVCPGGKSLLSHLKTGVFDCDIAKRVSDFLAQCHATVKPIEPLWDDREADLEHWETMLEMGTSKIKVSELPDKTLRDLETLRHKSRNETRICLINLNFLPKNIILDNGKIGVIDFELSSGVGDPAFDIGGFLGHYIFWAIVTSTKIESRDTVAAALTKYSMVMEKFWFDMQPRVVGFAGASILKGVAEKREITGQIKNRLITTGIRLLSSVRRNSVDPISWLTQAHLYGE